MDILGKKLLIITAHPDDESFMAAGTIHLNHQHGGRTILVCATEGERGKHHLTKLLTSAKLKQLRKQELRNVSKFLHVHKLLHLKLPDGELKLPAHIKKLYRHSLGIAQIERPDFIVSFGSDGITGHYDHISVAEVASKIAKKLNIKLLTFALPPKVIPNAHNWLGVRRKSDCYCEVVIYGQPTIKIPIDKKVKLTALKMHKSQFAGKDPLYHFPARAAKEILAAEWFISQD